MAGLGRKIFTAGDVLTASDVQSYLMDQTVMNFAGTAARSSAIATPTEGMVTYLADSDALEVYDGAAYVAVGGSSALTLVKTQTVGTTVSSVTVTDAFSATYDDYRVLVSGVTCSATGSNLAMVFNNSSGSFYYYGGQAQEFAGGISARSASAGASIEIALTGSLTTTNVNIDIFNPFLAQATGFVGAYGTNTYSGRFAGYNSTTTSQTGFTFTPGSGTMTGGQIRVYGYQK